MIFENDELNQQQSPISIQVNNFIPQERLISNQELYMNNDGCQQIIQNQIDSINNRQLNRHLTIDEVENQFLCIDEIIQNAIIAMKKPINQRNHIEQRAIIRVIESNKFLQKTKKYNKNLLNLIANCIEYEKIQKGKPVFQYGDRPDKFYLIIQGKVSVLVPKTKNEIAQLKEEMMNDTFQYSLESPMKRKYTDIGDSLYLSFPDMIFKQKTKAQETNSENSSPRLQTMDSYGDEMSSPSSNIIKKSNFSMGGSEKLNGWNKDIKRITQDLNLQLSKKSSFSLSKKRIDGNQYSEEDRIIPEIPLSKTEILNWKQYFLNENDMTIAKYNHIKFLNDGDVFGDFGLIMRKPRSASILAVQDTLLLTIQKSDYEQLIREISYVNIFIQNELTFKKRGLYLVKQKVQNKLYLFLKNIVISHMSSVFFNSRQYAKNRKDIQNILGYFLN